jgi:SPX domain protein involved in polyphosphate accumulation/uncharacterized membrane protein YidH (DUF202 family)
MRFGKTLRNSIYPPWKDEYIDYGGLKALLREDADDERHWTEEDEKAFSDEILNVQLEKVAAFQEATSKQLEERTNKAAARLRELAPEDRKPKGIITIDRFHEVEQELDSILNEVKELKKYSNINYTGFLKIVKKHDRKRGSDYKIRPMLQHALSQRPFNSEQGYTPILNKISMLFFVVQQQLSESSEQPGASASAASDAQSQTQNVEKYTAHKCKLHSIISQNDQANQHPVWIHPDNLLEVKTFILRRLPVLVYSDKTSKDLEAQGDPTLNSLYFDNPNFSLYSEKVDRQVDASSLRIRWSGQLSQTPELFIEQKIIHENGSSEEKRIPIKEKWIQPFITGQYKMEKTIAKMERSQQPAAIIQDFKNKVNEIQKFILDNELQPVLRANYTRTAFQQPLNDRVRVSIDTDVAFLREDALDSERPCRDPEIWHRLDVDNTSMAYPFSSIRRGEISRFPYSLLEIKLKEGVSSKQTQWVEDLSASGLVHQAPHFSKFVQGVASLFEDQVNAYPFWLSEVDTDIRQDPQAAFEEEEKRKLKQADDKAAIVSLLGTSKLSASFQGATFSPVRQSYLKDRVIEEERAGRRSDFSGKSKSQETQNDAVAGQSSGGYGTLSSAFPSFSISRYGRSQRAKSVALPPGVIEPTQLIKDSGPLMVEPKVWLANERTYIKWLHIAAFMLVLGMSLLNSGFQKGAGSIPKIMGCIYVGLALFTLAWGRHMQTTRQQMIRDRSGKDFDNMTGPLVVAAAMIVALILNFGLKVG